MRETDFLFLPLIHILMAELKSSSTGIESLSLGVTMTIGEYAIVDKLANFLIHHPEINIHLHYGNTSQLLKLLDNGQISMAIVEGNYPKEVYFHKKYSTEDYIAVCAASHHFISDHPHKSILARAKVLFYTVHDQLLTFVVSKL